VAKTGQDLPLPPSSGLFKTHGPATASRWVKLVHQGLLRPDLPARQKWSLPAKRLLMPESNVGLVWWAKFARLLHRPRVSPPNHLLEASADPRDARLLATAGPNLQQRKLDYSGQGILSYMQDPALHASSTANLQANESGR